MCCCQLRPCRHPASAAAAAVVVVASAAATPTPATAGHRLPRIKLHRPQLQKAAAFPPAPAPHLAAPAPTLARQLPTAAAAARAQLSGGYLCAWEHTWDTKMRCPSRNRSSRTSQQSQAAATAAAQHPPAAAAVAASKTSGLFCYTWGYTRVMQMRCHYSFSSSSSSMLHPAAQ